MLSNETIKTERDENEELKEKLGKIVEQQKATKAELLEKINILFSLKDTNKVLC